MTDPPVPNDSAITEAARDWIMRLSSGDMTEDELAAYRRWATDPAHQAIFQHELALWRSLGALGDRLAPADPLLIEGRAGVAFGRHPFRYAVAAVAACALLVVAGPELLLRARADHRTGVAVQTLTLPDGSRAVLDAGSAIAVHFGDDERRIDLLRGRAWFKVAHGNAKPFRVAAESALVEDVGTAFAVSYEEGRGEVGVTDGVIRVRSLGKESDWLTLCAGERASWDDDRTPVREADLPPARIAAWREGELLLDAVPVRRAVEAVARYRSGPTFVMGAVDQRAPVTAIVRLARPDEGLDALAASARLEILRLPGGIAIIRPAS